VLAFLIANIGSIKISLASFIQASIYCNFDYSPIQANCQKALIIYSNAALTGGLGIFIPQLQVMPTDPNLVDKDGWHLGNKGATRYKQLYVPALHPDDQDVANVQNPIMAVVDQILI
jgi:hypothetical protein